MSQDATIILGIDPGTRITGYGLIKCQRASHEVIDFGCIKPPPSLPFSERYLIIFNALEHLITTHKPDALSIETQFVYKNVQSALKLGMARGVALLAAAKNGIPIYEYAPKKAKLALVGNGSASKEQVQKMLQLLLQLKEVPEPEDAADALCLAICHAHSMHSPLNNHKLG